MRHLDTLVVLKNINFNLAYDKYQKEDRWWDAYTHGIDCPVLTL